MMNAQMKLPFEDIDGAATAANDNNPNQWKAKFEQFHAANPLVYELVKKYTLDVIATGRDTFSMTSIFERIRWYTDIETTGEDFKINQNFIPYYSRMFMSDHPQHEGFFRIRALGRKGARK